MTTAVLISFEGSTVNYTRCRVKLKMLMWVHGALSKGCVRKRMRARFFLWKKPFKISYLLFFLPVDVTEYGGLDSWMILIINIQVEGTSLRDVQHCVYL